MPDAKYIAEEVKRRRPKAIVSLFPKDGEMAVFEDSAYDVIGVSWTASPAQARAACPSKTLQGNLDPFLLYADPADIRQYVHSMVAEFGFDKYIANLGHGMLPTHPVEGPQAFMEGIDTAVRGGQVTPPASSVSPPAPNGAGPSPQLVLHVQEETSVSVPFSQEGSSQLQKALSDFIAMFKKKMGSETTQKWDNFEHTWQSGDLRLELFCNPNAFATIFDVKMFLTVRVGDQIKVTSDMPLSALQSDLESFSA